MSLPWQKNHQIRIHKYLSCSLMQSKIVPNSIFSNAWVLFKFKWFSFYRFFFFFFSAWYGIRWFRVCSFAISVIYWRTLSESELKKCSHFHGNRCPGRCGHSTFVSSFWKEELCIVVGEKRGKYCKVTLIGTRFLSPWQHKVSNCLGTLWAFEALPLPPRCCFSSRAIIGLHSVILLDDTLCPWAQLNFPSPL